MFPFLLGSLFFLVYILIFFLFGLLIIYMYMCSLVVFYSLSTEPIMATFGTPIARGYTYYQEPLSEPTAWVNFAFRLPSPSNLTKVQFYIHDNLGAGYTGNILIWQGDSAGHRYTLVFKQSLLYNPVMGQQTVSHQPTF